MNKEIKQLLENLRNKDGSTMSNDELGLSILIPYYYLFKDDEFLDGLNINGRMLKRKELMKEFNKRLKKVKKEYSLGEKHDE